MSSSLGYVAAPDADQGEQLGRPALVELHICGLSGEELMYTKPPAATLGWEVRQMVAERLPSKPGTRFLLHHGIWQLVLEKTLQEQGIVEEATLTYTFCPRNLHAAWSFIQEQASRDDAFALDGVTCIKGAVPAQPPRKPSKIDVW